jgi:DNA-binding GntR family transcriptional regulator
MKFQQIEKKRTTLGDGVYSYLRDAIISLSLEPGQMIYENELAKSFGVSRTPVREAFQLLLAEEFIEILPQRGIRIAYISKRKVEESWLVREILEVSVFKEVARNWNIEDDQCKKLRDQIFRILEEQKKAGLNNDYNEFFRLDEKYHQHILEQADNLTLLSIIAQMRGHLNRMRYLELQETKHTNRILNDHERIFQAIMSKDEMSVETLLRKHLEQLTSHVPQIVEKYPSYFQIK